MSGLPKLFPTSNWKRKLPPPEQTYRSLFKRTRRSRRRWRGKYFRYKTIKVNVIITHEHDPTDMIDEAGYGYIANTIRENEDALILETIRQDIEQAAIDNAIQN